MRPIGFAMLLFCLSVRPATSIAQVQNGTFESGGAGWTAELPPAWVGRGGASITFPATGGHPDGHVLLRSPIGNSHGEACVRQTFTCADPGGCTLSIDYRHGWIDSSALSGRVKIYFDGQQAFVSAPANTQPWTTECFNIVAPGTYELALCLDVSAGNNWWEAAFDTVVPADCMGTVSDTKASWGTLKSRFED